MGGRKITRPKILVLTSTYPRWKGDSEPAFVQRLSEELAEGADVHVLAPHFVNSQSVENEDSLKVFRFRYAPERFESLTYAGGIMENLKRSPWKYFLVPLFFTSQFIYLWRLHSKYQYDCIHAHWLIPQGITAVLFKRLICRNIPLLITSHGTDLFGLQGGIFTKLKKWVITNATHLTVVSNPMRDIAISMGAEERRITVQPMGVDLTKRFNTSDSLTTKRDYSRIIYIGRLIEKKGVDVLIKAFSLLHSKYPDVFLDIVGEGPYRHNLETLVGKYNLSSAVSLRGAVDNKFVPPYLQQAAIAVMPSTQPEGLGLVIIEALGCGCAVVASDLPATKDLIANEYSGLLVKPGDYKDLSEKIERLINDRELCIRIAQNGRDSVIERFDWKYVGNQYSRLIKSLVVK